MPDDSITVRFAAQDASGEAVLTAAEFGALMTALSRSLNKMVFDRATLTGWLPGNTVNARGYEPSLVGLKIVSLKAGSITLDAAITLLPNSDTLREIGKDLALGILSTAIYDKYGRKILLYDLGRAVKRVSKGAFGKSFGIVIRYRDKTISLHTTVSKEGKVKSGSDHFPEDDVQ
jgi:hypothetical protein